MDVTNDKGFGPVQIEKDKDALIELTMSEIQNTVRNLKDGVMLEIDLGGERAEKS